MKLLESSREKGTISKLEKELQDLEKINRTLQEKVKNTTKEIQEIEDQVSKVKEKVEAQEAAAVVN